MNRQLLKILPPSPVTDRITVDLRLGREPRAVRAEVRLSDESGASSTLYCGATPLPGCDPVVCRISTAGRVGRNLVTAEFYDEAGNCVATAEEQLEILAAGERSSGLIDGAWCGFYHWSEEEGRRWNRDLREFTAEDWRGMVHDMHQLGMNVIVLQELFRNQEYYGKHKIPETGYRGRAFYPSQLYPGRMPIACADPVEAVMAAADELSMAVLPGIGMYAWFDFTPESLAWHCRAAEEIFARYGHHRSFYGFYISEEVFGDLNYGVNGEDTEENIIEFFRRFRQFRNRIAPALPVMLAPNCFYIPRARKGWERLARELDIICPFAFNRMNPDDLSGVDAAALLQKIADENGAHLWMDMEAFNISKDLTLLVRDIHSLTEELQTFRSFEKILCYQYPGLFSAPDARLQPGGPETVELYRAYQTYYETCRKHLSPGRSPDTVRKNWNEPRLEKKQYAKEAVS